MTARMAEIPMQTFPSHRDHEMPVTDPGCFSCMSASVSLLVLCHGHGLLYKPHKQHCIEAFFSHVHDEGGGMMDGGKAYVMFEIGTVLNKVSNPRPAISFELEACIKSHSASQSGMLSKLDLFLTQSSGVLHSLGLSRQLPTI